LPRLSHPCFSLSYAAFSSASTYQCLCPHNKPPAIQQFLGFPITGLAHELLFGNHNEKSRASFFPEPRDQLQGTSLIITVGTKGTLLLYPPQVCRNELTTDRLTVEKGIQIYWKWTGDHRSVTDESLTQGA
jgi:hypothetical protein